MAVVLLIRGTLHAVVAEAAARLCANPDAVSDLDLALILLANPDRLADDLVAHLK